jgi:hypothetical protein
MAFNNIDNFLLSKWNGYNFGKTLREIIDLNDNTLRVNDPYFFLQSELDIKNPNQWRTARYNGTIRHCKPYGGKWLDYVVHKTFDTFAEWVEDCNGTLDDVLYGVNRVHKFPNATPVFVCLRHLMERLGYTHDVVNDTFAHIIMTKFIVKKDLSPEGQRCLVRRPDGSIVISRIFNRMFSYDRIEPATETVTVLSVPIDNDGTLREYTKLSQLPKGMKVYLQTIEGDFCSIKNLLK